MLSGKVLSERGEPLVGASVFIPSSSIGTRTDKQGGFMLENIPNERFKLAVSFVGYQVKILNVAAGTNASPYTIKLSLKPSELEEVIVRKYEKDGWRKWGKVFTDAFIGESAFSFNCSIENTATVKFVYSETGRQLYAYAGEPLTVENKALGYRISIELMDFKYSLDNNVVDYKMYPFFTKMEGTDEEEVVWKQNRELAYSLSLMHFMRSLHGNLLKQEGYQLRKVMLKSNLERQRVKEIYKSMQEDIQALAGNETLGEEGVLKKVERSFDKDSLKYYRRILRQEEYAKIVAPGNVSFKQIAQNTDTGTIILDFPDYLMVTYKREKEPIEFFNFKHQVDPDANNTLLRHTTALVAVQDWPSTVLNLTEGEAVEILETGYFNNTNLMLDGFWGWWEKLATRLPYEYLP